MKKVLSAFLAMVLLLGCLSGIVLAAENTVTEEVVLRPGKTVDVTTEEEFVDAYKAVYAENSEVNMIRLQADLKVYKVTLRYPEGNDPWMSGYEGTLVVRMPEGTCIDLNGCMLSMRANQGYDDNGTGKPSGDISIGKIIDTFEGGSVNLYTINEGKFIDRALEIAAENPDVVRTISMSNPVVDAADYDYVVPENVDFRFSGKQSEITCKSITFKPGATTSKGYPDTAPGLKDCGKVVFQYTDEADAQREGVRYATEMVKVLANPPAPKKVYKIVLKEGGAEEETTGPKYNLDVKTIKDPSVATTEAVVIENPTGKTPAAPKEYTKEMMQKMLVEAALAYYYHNPHIQYDGAKITASKSLERHVDNGAPEDAAADSLVYSVCSNYCWKVYHEVFNHPLFRMDFARTRTWADFAPGTVEVVYQYTGPQASKSKGETDLNKAMEESRKLLEVGDIIVGADANGGHAMLFVGDCLGDGTEYVLHSWGSSYDTATGADKVEGSGTILLQGVDEFLYEDHPNPNWYLAEDVHSAMGFAVLRPFLDPKFPTTPTAEGLARLQYPGLNVWRELDRNRFAGAMTGEEIPVYLTIANKGKETLNEVPVEEYIPEGTTLVEGSATVGAKIEGNTIKWAVKIPAGKELTLTYKVKLNAELGETVTFPRGNVAGLHSRETSLTIGGKRLTDEQNAAIMDYAREAIAAGNVGVGDAFEDTAFFNKFYEGALGIDLDLPGTAKEIVSKLAKGLFAVERKSEVALEDSPLDRMVMPLHFTGQYVEHKTNWERVANYDPDFYQPGDMVVGLRGVNDTNVYDINELDLFIYLGDSRVLKYTTDGLELMTFGNSIGKGLLYNVFIALRPTLTYEDVNERAVSKMTFTDVLEADWFSTYVKDLVYDGTVNGMTATTFAPKGNLTYGQALKLITLAVGESEQAAVSGQHWASGYEKLAAAKGWIAGSVDLNKAITRLQFCQIAAKAAGITGAPAKNPFADCSDAAVLALNNAGVINGMSEGTFAPNNLLTRAQISKIIWCLREVA